MPSRQERGFLGCIAAHKRCLTIFLLSSYVIPILCGTSIALYERMSHNHFRAQLAHAVCAIDRVRPSALAIHATVCRGTATARLREQS